MHDSSCMIKPTRISLGGTVAIVTSAAPLAGLDAANVGEATVMRALLIAGAHRVSEVVGYCPGTSLENSNLTPRFVVHLGKPVVGNQLYSRMSPLLSELEHKTHAVGHWVACVQPKWEFCAAKPF